MVTINYGDTFSDLYSFVLIPDPDDENSVKILARYIIARHCIEGYDKTKNKFLFKYKSIITEREFEEYFQDILFDIKENANNDTEKSIIEEEEYYSEDYTKHRVNVSGLLRVLPEDKVSKNFNTSLHFQMAILCICILSVSYDEENDEIIYDFSEKEITRSKMLEILNKYLDSIEGIDHEIFIEHVKIESFPKILENIIGGSGLLEISSKEVNQ